MTIWPTDGAAHATPSQKNTSPVSSTWSTSPATSALPSSLTDGRVSVELAESQSSVASATAFQAGSATGSPVRSQGDGLALRVFLHEPHLEPVHGDLVG